MKRWWLIGGALGLLAVLVGGMLQRQGMLRPLRSAASIKSVDDHTTHAEAASTERNMFATSIKPADEQVMRYLHTLLETWKSHVPEPTRQKP